MATTTKPTVTVVRGSVDEQALRSQYGDSINIQYGNNQFTGSNRTDTNQQYQNYLSQNGVTAANNSVDLKSLTGTKVVNGKSADGSSDLDAALTSLLNQAQANSDAYLQSQTAMLQSNLNSAIAELQKTYQNAVAEGEISVRDAEDNLASDVAALQKEAYNDAERTAVFGEGQGIQNSQQMVGLMAGDAARKNTNITTAQKTRDQTVANIKTRLNAIKTNTDTDIATANANYNSDVAAASAQASQMYNSSVMGILGDDYSNKQNQFYTEKNAATAQQYELTQMAKQQEYTQTNMTLEQKYKKELAAIENSYQLGQISASAAASAKAKLAADQSDFVQMCKAYGINPNASDAAYQLRVAQINESQAIKKADIFLDASTKAEADSIINNPALKYSDEEKLSYNPFDDSNIFNYNPYTGTSSSTGYYDPIFAPMWLGNLIDNNSRSSGEQLAAKEAAQAALERLYNPTFK